MSIEFRLLPVRDGEASLLRSARGNYLVDAGAPGSCLPELLRKRRAEKLRAVVCSMLNWHRFGGIIDLMEAKLRVSEYWLPSGLADIIDLAWRFNGDWDGWQNSLGSACEAAQSTDSRNFWSLPEALPDSGQMLIEAGAVLLTLAITAYQGPSPFTSVSRREFLEDYLDEDENVGFTQEVLEYLAKAEGAGSDNDTQQVSQSTLELIRRVTYRQVTLAAGHQLMSETAKLRGAKRIIVRRLTMAAMFAVLMADSPVHFRFFKPTGQYESALISRHPFRCLNGKEVSFPEGGLEEATPEMIVETIKSMGTFSNGLVFQYGDAQSSVLFPGESRFRFLDDEVVELDRPTVVVAPGRGSSRADEAYSRIISHEPESDIWVCSHVSTQPKRSRFFIQNENRLCLFNCRRLSLQEVVLEYSKDAWSVLSGGGCSCGE